METLTILALTLTLTSAASAAQPIPQFSSGSGKRYNMEVRADETNPSRLRIWFSEWGKLEGAFTRQMARQGFAVKDSDTVEFLIPASACVFANRFLLNCDTRRLSRAEQQQVELSFHTSGRSENPDLRILGRDMNEHSLNVRLGTQIDETTKVDEHGQLTKERSLGFTSRVWIYESEVKSGHFFHDVTGLRL